MGAGGGGRLPHTKSSKEGFVYKSPKVMLVAKKDVNRNVGVRWIETEQ